jgi:tight adherence protein C
MIADSVLLTAGVLTAGSLLVLILLLRQGRADAVSRRIAQLNNPGAARFAAGTTENGVPQTGSAPPAMESTLEQRAKRRFRQEKRKHTLQQRMIQAGLYSSAAARVFSLFRMALLCIPAVLGLAAAQIGLLSPTQGILYGAIAGLAGTLAPTFWLDYVTRSRQTQVRRGLPDALDIIGVCLQAGLSLPSALAKVTRELAMAHPVLATELSIVERHVQMGRSTGEAMQELAGRLDLEELRSMASTLIQSERIGASIAAALEVFADTLRLKRHQRAEEMAHKASVKMLFPTLLFIFPAIFVVILGPAAIQIYEQLLHGAMTGSGH